MAFEAIRRADGELIYGEFAWMGADGRDWVVAEEAEDDDPTVYEMVEMRPLLIERRTYLNGRWIDDPANPVEAAVELEAGR